MTSKKQEVYIHLSSALSSLEEAERSPALSKTEARDLRVDVLEPLDAFIEEFKENM